MSGKIQYVKVSMSDVIDYFSKDFYIPDDPSCNVLVDKYFIDPSCNYVTFVIKQEKSDETES